MMQGKVSHGSKAKELERQWREGSCQGEIRHPRPVQTVARENWAHGQGKTFLTRKLMLTTVIAKSFFAEPF